MISYQNGYQIVSSDCSVGYIEFKGGALLGIWTGMASKAQIEG